MNFDSTTEFDEQLSRLTRMNKALEERLLKKTGQILDYPSIDASKRTPA